MTTNILKKTITEDIVELRIYQREQGMEAMCFVVEINMKDKEPFYSLNFTSLKQATCYCLGFIKAYQIFKK